MKHLLQDKDEETCYKEMFRILDDQKKGFIDNEKLKGMFIKMKHDVQMSDEEVDEVVELIDKNKDGRVDFNGAYFIFTQVIYFVVTNVLNS